jgi:uncharacterized protein YabE (DUF348 family)
MNKIDILNKLHEAFPKVRNVSLIVFILAITAVTLKSNFVYGEADNPGYLTKVKVNFDHQSKSILTTGKNVLEALDEGGISLAKNDITNPPLDTKLTGGDFSVEITRALPVLISDNNQEHLAFSAYSGTKDILKQLDISVYPEDIVDAQLIMDPVDEGTAGQKIVIKRAPSFSVEVDGKTEVIRSWGKSVGDVLSGHVLLGQKDIIEPSTDSSAPTDGKIVITRVNVAEVEATETISFSVVQKNDYSMFQGQTKIEKQGSNGEKKVKYRITYHNGQEVDKVVLSLETISQPVAQVVIKGMKPYNAGAWWDTLVAAGNKYGVNPASLLNVMNCESHGNPNSIGWANGLPKYYGLFQYNLGLWSTASAAAGFGGADWSNGEAQIYATAKHASQYGWSAWGCKP